MNYIVKALYINFITTIFDSIFLLYHENTESRKVKPEFMNCYELVMMNISCWANQWLNLLDCFYFFCLFSERINGVRWQKLRHYSIPFLLSLSAYSEMTD